MLRFSLFYRRKFRKKRLFEHFACKSGKRTKLTGAKLAKTYIDVKQTFNIMIRYRNVCGVTPAHNEFLGGVFVKPKVYFTKTVTPEKVIEMYKQLDCKLPGNVSIKVHSGDYFGGLAQVYLFAVIGAVLPSSPWQRAQSTWSPLPKCAAPTHLFRHPQRLPCRCPCSPLLRPLLRRTSKKTSKSKIQKPSPAGNRFSCLRAIFYVFLF